VGEGRLPGGGLADLVFLAEDLVGRGGFVLLAEEFGVDLGEGDRGGADLGDGADAIVDPQRVADVGGGSDHGPGGEASGGGAGLEGQLVGRVVHGDVEGVALAADVAHVDGDEAELLGDFPGNQVEQVAREVDMVEGDPGGVELLGEHLGELDLVECAGLDEEGAEPAPVELLGPEGGRELLGGDDASLDEELTQTRTSGDHEPG
jgi:hypothetical protein